MDQAVVIEALERQVALYRQLAKLAEIQHACVQNEQTEELLAVLEKRQGVLNGISTLESAMAPVRKNWREFVAALSDEHRQTAETLMLESRRLLEEITTADRHDALVLQQRKLSLGRQLNQTRAAKQVNRSYAGAAYSKSAGSRLDLKGQ